MSSIFLRNLKERKVTVSFLFYEVLGALLDKDPDLEIGSLVATGLVQTGQVTVEQLRADPEIVSYAISRMDITRQQIEESDRKSRSRKRQYGEQFVSWFENLGPVEKCLFASDYDYDKSRKLYCDMDRSDACEIVKAKFELQFEVGIMNFEATVFGMGGSFGNATAPGKVTDFAVPEMSESQLDASAKSFMQMLGR